VVEPKLLYLQQMEAFCEARDNKHNERDLHVRIKEMHTHMRETKLKEEEEEEIKQREEALRKQEEELGIWEEELENHKKETCYSISLHTVGSTLCCNPI
jgi:hypothetical protein